MLLHPTFYCYPSVKLEAPTTTGRVVGSAEPEGDSIDMPALVGECFGVEVEVEGVKLPCLLDTGSQVTLFSQSFFQKWLGHCPVQKKEGIDWLKLKAANGLQIPYIGYVVLDFVIGGLVIPQKGVVITTDECLGSERGLLGMNVINHCWEELFTGTGPGPRAFQTTLSTRATHE